MACCYRNSQVVNSSAGNLYDLGLGIYRNRYSIQTSYDIWWNHWGYGLPRAYAILHYLVANYTKPKYFVNSAMKYICSISLPCYASSNASSIFTHCAKKALKLYRFRRNMLTAYISQNQCPQYIIESRPSLAGWQSLTDHCRLITDRYFLPPTDN